jgi:two-component system cell cycle response regulator
MGGDQDVSHTVPISIVPLDDNEKAVPCLIVISGPEMGKAFPLRSAETKVGRAEDTDFSLRDQSISRNHAIVYKDHLGCCRVQDLGSTNGTFINGRKVKDVALTAGDRIQLGESTVLKLEYHGKIEDDFHSQLYDAGTRDALTEVFNRRYLDQHLDTDFRLAVRHQEQLSVVIIDVDYFKKVNDTHGHLAGDMVLRTLSNVLKERIRDEDILARYGGEEFVLVLRRTPEIGAVALAESIRNIIEKTPFSYQNQDIAVTVSSGVATLTHPSSFIDGLSLLKEADMALYRAKAAGRNRVEVAKPKTSGSQVPGRM